MNQRPENVLVPMATLERVMNYIISQSVPQIPYAGVNQLVNELQQAVQTAMVPQKEPDNPYGVKTVPLKQEAKED